MKYVIISWCKLGRRNSDPWWKIKVPAFLLAFLPWRRQPGKVLAKTWEAGEQNLCWISQGEDEGELVEGTELQGQEVESGLSPQQWCWAPSWAETLWPRTKPQWMRSDLEVDGWYQEGKREEMQGSSQCPSQAHACVWWWPREARSILLPLLDGTGTGRKWCPPRISSRQEKGTLSKIWGRAGVASIGPKVKGHWEHPGLEL